MHTVNAEGNMSDTIYVINICTQLC